MRRGIVAIALITWLAAPAAHAQPFRPLPGVGTCLRATGTPGELAVRGARGIDLLGSSAERVRLGRLAGCPEVATEPSGAAVAAAPVRRGRLELRAVVRDPGGAFGAPVRLGGISSRVRRPAAAVSARGDAVVAWARYRGSESDGTARARIMAARRLPGARFAAARPLTPWFRVAGPQSVGVAVEVDASGTATVVWKRAPAPIMTGRASVEVASAAPGAQLGPPQRVGTTNWFDPPPPALAVAPGGRALLAFSEPRGISVLERAAGSATFVPAVRFSGYLTGPSVAVRDDGAAVVAWRTGDELESGVAASTRPAGGAFAPARAVAPDHRPTGAHATEGAGLVAPLDLSNFHLKAALADDERALLTWAAPRPFHGAVITTPIAAHGTLALGIGAPAAFGSPSRAANGVVPLALPDGSLRMVWTDNVPARDVPGSVPEWPAGGGRLHTADSAQAPPRASARAIRADGVRVAVRCAAACDVRASVPTSGGVVGGGAAASLPRAGRRVLRLRGLPGEPVAWRGGTVRVRVIVTAPGSSRARLLSARVSLGRSRA